MSKSHLALRLCSFCFAKCSLLLLGTCLNDFNTINSTNVCMSCGVTFAEWHCAKCNLWMDLGKRPFHCDKCGICRVGGRDKFQHCEQCCMCISVSVFETHNCIKDKYKSESYQNLISIMLDVKCTSLCFAQFVHPYSQLSGVPRRYVFVSSEPPRVALWTCYSCEYNFILPCQSTFAIFILT